MQVSTNIVAIIQMQNRPIVYEPSSTENRIYFFCHRFRQENKEKAVQLLDERLQDLPLMDKLFKATMIILTLLSQNFQLSSKSKDSSEALEKRIDP